MVGTTGTVCSGPVNRSIVSLPLESEAVRKSETEIHSIVGAASSDTLGRGIDRKNVSDEE